MNSINILGVEVHNISRQELMGEIGRFLAGGKQHYITTPNPEIILKTQKDSRYYEAVNRADIKIPDGFGLFCAGLARGKAINRLTGSDLTVELLKYAEKHDIKIAVFNWRHGLSSKEDITAALKEKYPKLKFAIENIDREWSMPYYQNINIWQPRIIFVNLGAPWQELFLADNLPRMPYVRLGLGIGGSFDLLTGRAKRAPRVFCAFGFEWLWRLFRQPIKRSGRILNAAFVFPFKFIKWLWLNPWLYRPSVACLIYKQERGKVKILTAKRKTPADHWQIPQGGRDGQSPLSAGLREAYEELGIKKIKARKVYKNIYKYKVTDNPWWRRRRRYRGQRQSLLIAEFTGNDNEIKTDGAEFTDWQWVDKDDFLKKTHPRRRQAYELYLKKLLIQKI